MKKMMWSAALIGFVMTPGFARAGDAVEFRSDEAPGRAIAERSRPAHEMALLEIQEEGRVAVLAVASQLERISDPQRRRELQRQVVQLKQDYRLRFLEALASSAEQRGEQAVAEEARRQIQLIHSPPRPASKPVLREGPSKDGRFERKERP